MLINFIRISCVSVGLFIMYFFANYFNKIVAPDADTKLQLTNRAGFMLAGALLGILITPYVNREILLAHKNTNSILRKYPPSVLISAFLGLVIGIIFSVLLSLPIYLFLPQLKIVGLILFFCFSVVFAYFGILILSRAPLFAVFDPRMTRNSAYLQPSTQFAAPKVLDTNIIIDGRILDLLQNNFIEGRIYVPIFVLTEIQKIADDIEPIRNKKGKRGLEILEKIKNIPDIQIEISNQLPQDNSLLDSVDTKLVNFAKSIEGTLVTNDFNLAKIAQLMNVKVININTLTSSLKHALSPGDEIEVNIVKYGKEMGQGIAYLDDGTMLVIEKGDTFIGESVLVEITSLLHTNAGRLLFAKIVSKLEN